VEVYRHDLPSTRGLLVRYVIEGISGQLLPRDRRFKWLHAMGRMGKSAMGGNRCG